MDRLLEFIIYILFIDFHAYFYNRPSFMDFSYFIFTISNRSNYAFIYIPRWSIGCFGLNIISPFIEYLLWFWLDLLLALTLNGVADADRDVMNYFYYCYIIFYILAILLDQLLYFLMLIQYLFLSRYFPCYYLCLFLFIFLCYYQYFHSYSRKVYSLMILDSSIDFSFIYFLLLYFVLLYLINF